MAFRKITHWTRTHGWVVLIYSVFLSTITYEIHQRIRYHDVGNWPSVPTTRFEIKSGHVPVKFEWFTGPRNGMIDTTYVTFEYEVDGISYQGNRASPNGDSMVLFPQLRNPRAYYHPESPEIAVLAPISYVTSGHLYVALMSGMMVVTHLCFTLPGLISMLRYRRIRRWTGGI